MPIIAGLALATAVVVVLLGLVALFQSVHAETVYPGVRVGEVHVGGMTMERALAELAPLYEARVNRPLLIRVADIERQERLDGLGATLDPRAAVDAAFSVGRTGGWREDLAVQIDSLLNGHAVESPGVRIDRARVQAYVAQAAKSVDRPVKDAELIIDPDLAVKVTSSVVGRQVEIGAAVQVLERAMLEGEEIVVLPVRETQPKRTESDLESARTELTALFGGPAELVFKDQRWGFSLEEIQSLVSVEEKPGVAALTVSLDKKPLEELVAAIAGELDQPKINARFDWNGGNLKMLSVGQDGREVDQEKALEALLGAMKGKDRSVALPVEVKKAAGDSIDPSQLGIVEEVEFGRTPIAGVPEKIHNVKLAASRLNGVLLAPGDTFSFNTELGPTTLKSGYQTGFAISVNDGQMETVPAVAGGICQVASTLLQAVFWAGYQIELRYPHMYWIPNYGKPPKGLVGLDATVDDPVLDFKFTNNSDGYVLIQSRVQDNNLEFVLYGKKPGWRVEVDGPIITDVVKADPKVVREIEPTWPEGKEVWVESATDGMKVNIIRRVISGSEVRTLELKSDYRASRNVVLVGGKKAEPTPEPTPAPGETPTAQPSAPTEEGTPAPEPTSPESTPEPAASDTPDEQPTPAAVEATEQPSPNEPASSPAA